MKTFLVSFGNRDGGIGLVELSSTPKLLLWLIFRIRHLMYLHITVGKNGDYNLMVKGHDQEDPA